jgi:hypothetical protein
VHASGAYECVPCALAWDDGDTRPPCARVTYEQLIDALVDEALRIEAGAKVVTLPSGTSPPLRQFRYQPSLRRAMALRVATILIARARDARKKRGGAR